MMKKKVLPLFAAIGLLCTLSLPACKASNEIASKGDTIFLNVYNSADYILEDSYEEDEDGNKVKIPGIVSQSQLFDI